MGEMSYKVMVAHTGKVKLTINEPKQRVANLYVNGADARSLFWGHLPSE